MALSDNTGNSTGAHLHLTVKRGKKEHLSGKFVSDNYNNGYFGAINPQEFFDELRKFKAAQPKGDDVLLNAAKTVVDGQGSPGDKIAKLRELLKT